MRAACATMRVKVHISYHISAVVYMRIMRRGVLDCIDESATCC